MPTDDRERPEIVEIHRTESATIPRRRTVTAAKFRTLRPPLSLDDFVAYMPQHSYIFRPNGEMWPATSVNARIRPVASAQRMPAKVWLDRHQAVEQMTWAPGLPTDIRDRLVTAGGWIKRPGCTVFNLYRPPSLRARPGDASRWVDHVTKLFGDDAPHLIHWLAHRVQFPDEKINHCVVLGGNQGIGKDTLLEPVKQAVGPWNFAEVSPVQLLGRFNGFLKSVVLRVSEARDLGEVNSYAFMTTSKRSRPRRQTCCGSTRRTSVNTRSSTSAASS